MPLASLGSQPCFPHPRGGPKRKVGQAVGGLNGQAPPLLHPSWTSEPQAFSSVDRCLWLRKKNDPAEDMALLGGALTRAKPCPKCT